MRRSHHHQHTRLPNHQPPQPMNQCHIPHAKPRHRLTGQPAHLIQRHLPISFIVQMQRLPSARIVPHNPIEDAHCPIRPRLHLGHYLRRRNHSLDNLNPHTVPIFQPQSNHSPAAAEPPHLHPSRPHQPSHTPDSPPQQSSPTESPQSALCRRSKPPQR